MDCPSPTSPQRSRPYAPWALPGSPHPTSPPCSSPRPDSHLDRGGTRVVPGLRAGPPGRGRPGRSRRPGTGPRGDPHDDRGRPRTRPPAPATLRLVRGLDPRCSAAAARRTGPSFAGGPAGGRGPGQRLVRAAGRRPVGRDRCQRRGSVVAGAARARRPTTRPPDRCTCRCPGPRHRPRRDPPACVPAGRRLRAPITDPDCRGQRARPAPVHRQQGSPRQVAAVARGRRSSSWPDCSARASPPVPPSGCCWTAGRPGPPTRDCSRSWPTKARTSPAAR